MNTIKVPPNAWPKKDSALTNSIMINPLGWIRVQKLGHNSLQIWLHAKNEEIFPFGLAATNKPSCTASNFVWMVKYPLSFFPYYNNIFPSKSLKIPSIPPFRTCHKRAIDVNFNDSSFRQHPNIGSSSRSITSSGLLIISIINGTILLHSLFTYQAKWKRNHCRWCC